MIIIERFFITVGFGTVSLMLVLLFSYLKEKFNIWRKHKCKIKCLCKHEYKLEWVSYMNYPNEFCMKCDKCGKRKKFTAVADSFKDMV